MAALQQSIHFAALSPSSGKADEGTRTPDPLLTMEVVYCISNPLVERNSVS